MKIIDLIHEEAGRFQAAYDFRPDFVFIGAKQAREIDDLINQMRTLGLIEDGNPLPRATIFGMKIFKVDAESHLSFGVEQPSPCG